MLHEDSIFPRQLAGIPINIRNTNRPSDPGTMIVPPPTATARASSPASRGKKGFAVVHIEKDMMNQELGFGMRVLQVLNDMGLCFEHLPSGIDTMGVVLDEKGDFRQASGTSSPPLRRGDRAGSYRDREGTVAHRRRRPRNDQNARHRVARVYGGRARGHQHPHDRSGGRAS